MGRRREATKAGPDEQKERGSNPIAAAPGDRVPRRRAGRLLPAPVVGVLVAAGVVVVLPRLSATVAAAATDPVVVAAGDIACDPADPNFSGADPSTCQMGATARLF